MTLRQHILKLLYPVLMYFTKKKNINATVKVNNIAPHEPFYTLRSTLNNGKELSFETLKGKKVLLVNTASNCGYTNQFTDLQTLHEKYTESLVVLGFPANDFKEQEKGDDAEIEQFCKINFGVTFSLMRKSSVVKGPDQNPVFDWLTNQEKNGWNSKAPSWNFSKYLIDENGKLVNCFGPSISPISKEVLDAVIA